jgi:hypothetical protein
MLMTSLVLSKGGGAQRWHAKRILPSKLDKVFCPLDAGDNPHRQEAVSVKKMLKGDATWATRKAVLGWIVDTLKLAMELPEHQIVIVLLFEILAGVQPSQRRITTKKWQQLLWELPSMVLTIRV